MFARDCWLAQLPKCRISINTFGGAARFGTTAAFDTETSGQVVCERVVVLGAVRVSWPAVAPHLERETPYLVPAVAVLTVPANDFAKPLHDRMPAILGEEHFGAWLDPKESHAEKLLPLLTSYPVERMEMWLVRDRVNSVNADGAYLLTKV
jgi:hypothetical protein